jgi:hypothetical protein
LEAKCTPTARSLCPQTQTPLSLSLSLSLTHTHALSHHPQVRGFEAKYRDDLRKTEAENDELSKEAESAMVVISKTARALTAKAAAVEPHPELVSAQAMLQQYITKYSLP